MNKIIYFFLKENTAFFTTLDRKKKETFKHFNISQVHIKSNLTVIKQP